MKRKCLSRIYKHFFNSPVTPHDSLTEPKRLKKYEIYQKDVTSSPVKNTGHTNI